MDHDGNFYRGLIIGGLISTGLWALIVWGITTAAGIE